MNYILIKILTTAMIFFTSNQDIQKPQEAIVEKNEITIESASPIITTESYLLTEDEIDLIAWITMGEAEGESEYGKRLVIDTILNRVDDSCFPDTVNGVVYQKSQFSCVWDGRLDRCSPNDKVRQLVIEELENRTNYDVLFFTADKYGAYGKHLFQEGNHYFCGKE